MLSEPSNSPPRGTTNASVASVDRGRYLGALLGAPAPRSRSKRRHPAATRLRRAIEAGAAVVVPAICARLLALMAPFPVLVASRAHHVAAARIANECRAGGIAAGAVDALIAALTLEHGARLLTSDADFQHIAQHCDLKLERY